VIVVAVISVVVIKEN